MKEKRDVLFLCQFYSPEFAAVAGLATDTAEALAAAGYSVDVICGYPKSYDSAGEGAVPMREVRNGVGIRRLRYIAAGKKNVIRRLVNSYSFYFASLVRLFSMRKYKLIVTYSNPPMLPHVMTLASKLFGCKTAFIAHDVYPEIAIHTGMCMEHGLMAGRMRSINRMLAKRLTGLVSISSEMTDFFVEKRGIDRERITTIPNWHRDTFEEAHGGSGGKFTCGYFGNMGICQDMETILSCIEKYDDGIDYVFAGQGTKKEDVEKRVAGLSNVTVHGFLTGQAFSDTLAACDCCVVSLEKGLGGLCAPSKTYSYLMMGKPIIAVMDEKDIIADIERYKCGFAVENGDTEGLRKALETLRDDPELRAEMAAGARKCFLENYTREKCCGKLAEFVRGMIGDPENETNR
ncbi:MAG: glycosyltransferase family 4 protein [Clostridia bacterium]|nr:glycosyltransferase family 4 protein [Clostridia bacterium]